MIECLNNKSGDGWFFAFDAMRLMWIFDPIFNGIKKKPLIAEQILWYLKAEVHAKSLKENTSASCINMAYNTTKFSLVYVLLKNICLLMYGYTVDIFTV